MLSSMAWSPWSPNSQTPHCWRTVLATCCWTSTWKYLRWTRAGRVCNSSPWGSGIRCTCGRSRTCSVRILRFCWGRVGCATCRCCLRILILSRCFRWCYEAGWGGSWITDGLIFGIIILLGIRCHDRFRRWKIGRSCICKCILFLI